MSDFPSSVMIWRSVPTLSHVGTWATERYPADAVEYVQKSDFVRVRDAAVLGLQMAEANDLWNTAETIREALDNKAAPTLSAALELPEPAPQMDRTDIVDTITDIIGETHDIDVRDEHYAEALVRWLEQNLPAPSPQSRSRDE